MTNKEKFVYYSSPEHWLQTSLELNETIKELLRIADKSHYYESYHPDEKEPIKRSSISRAAFLLMAYSLENLLKGIVILMDPNLVNKGKMDSNLKSHNLNKLTILADISIPQEEIEFQDYISKLCVANARYPIGLNENQILKHPSIENRDFEIYDSLFLKYREILTKDFNKFGWESGLKNEKLNTKPGEFNFIINPFFRDREH